MICDDFTGTVVLVSEDTVFESDDRVGGANGFDLGGDGLRYVVRGDFERAREVLVATVGILG